MINIKFWIFPRYFLLIFLIGFLVTFSLGNDINWSENFFPFSTESLASGNTFSKDLSSNYISPSLKNKSNLYFSTSFLKADVQVYYFVYQLKSFSFDIFYYDWNKMDYRDEEGNDLGHYYSSNYSGSISYTYSFKNCNSGLQIRYNLKEIGNIINDKIFVSPYISYDNDLLNMGVTIKNYNLNSFLFFGGINYKLITAKTRIDYFNEEYKFNYGFDFYLNEDNNYVLFLGVADKRFTAGFGINSRDITFNYGFMLENEQVFINNFGIRIDL